MKEKNEEKRPAGQFELGNERDDALMDSRGSGAQFLKMDNVNGPNIFGLFHNRFFTKVEHWFELEGKRESAICAVHASNDPEKIVKGKAVDDCPWCARVEELFAEAKQDPDSAIGKKKKEIALDLNSKPNFIFIAAKGEADITRAGAQRIIKPFFDNIEDYGLLPLSGASFDMLRAQVKKDGFSGQDLIGMPVNFQRGKKSDKVRFAQVLEVQFFPKNKIKVPDIDPDQEFAGLAVYDGAKSAEQFQKWEAEFAEMFDEIKAPAKKAAAGKSRK